jgi:hypothetical protein
MEIAYQAQAVHCEQVSRNIDREIMHSQRRI